MFYFWNGKIKAVFLFNYEVDQPPRAIIWLLEAVITISQWLGHRKRVIF